MLLILPQQLIHFIIMEATLTSYLSSLFQASLQAKQNPDHPQPKLARIKGLHLQPHAEVSSNQILEAFSHLESQQSTVETEGDQHSSASSGEDENDL
jgi:hypothetical protein